MADALDDLRRGVRRDAHLDGLAGRLLCESGEEVLGQQPEIGTVGLSEEDAGKRYGELEVYRAQFRPLKATLSGRAERMIMKLIVDAASRKVVGAHILGHDAGEMAQLLGITLKAGCTKDDFDRTMALHPTAAEELVTMYAPSYRIRDGKRL